MAYRDIEKRRQRDLERFRRRTDARRAAGLCLKCGKTEPARPQAETRSLTLNRAHGLTVVIVLSTVPLSTPGSSKVPLPSLRRDRHAREHPAPVGVRPQRAGSEPRRRGASRRCPNPPRRRKRPCAARPQAARPGPEPSPAPARWNELPSSSSRPVTVRAGDEGRPEGRRRQAGGGGRRGRRRARSARTGRRRSPAPARRSAARAPSGSPPAPCRHRCA